MAREMSRCVDDVHATVPVEIERARERADRGPFCVRRVDESGPLEGDVDRVQSILEVGALGVDDGLRPCPKEECRVRERPWGACVVKMDVRDRNVLHIPARDTTFLQCGRDIAPFELHPHPRCGGACSGKVFGVGPDAEVEEERLAGAGMAEHESQAWEMSHFINSGDVDELPKQHVDTAGVYGGNLAVCLVCGGGWKIHGLCG